MNEDYLKKLENILNETNIRSYKNNLESFEKLTEEFPEYKFETIFQMANFILQSRAYAESVFQYMECYKNDYRKEEIVKILLERFYKNNLANYINSYEKNAELLKKYEYIENFKPLDYEELDYLFINYSPNKYLVYSKEKNDLILSLNFSQFKYSGYKLNKNEVIIFNNEFNLLNIYQVLKATADTESPDNIKTPIYLYYDDKKTLSEYMQIWDFRSILDFKRVVFLFGYEELEKYLLDDQSHLPDHILNVSDPNKSSDKENLYHIVSNIVNSKKDNSTLVTEYYENLGKDYFLNKIRNGEAKILFGTSRFTTALQYYIKDCRDACNSLDIENDLIIEKSDLHRTFAGSWINAVNTYKPDLIFTIDHFRWKNPGIPKNIPFLTWIQDPLTHIMDKGSPAKTDNMNFLLNAYFTWKEFDEIGYSKENIIECPMPVNENIYKNYELTEKEKIDYSADICLFSNAGNPYKGVELFINHFTKQPEILLNLESSARNALDQLYSSSRNGAFVFDKDEYEKILKLHLEKNGLDFYGWTEESRKNLLDRFRFDIGYRIMRSVPAEWLHERNYDMKIWGAEWVEHPVLSKYAKGVAQNGETLSRIINASKIVLGTNMGMSTHPRVFETILSGSFYIGMKIPEEYDAANITHFLKEGEDIVFAYGKDDLYKKIDYYLEHEDERKRIVENGRKKILEKLTYKAMMKRVLDEVAIKLEKQIEEDRTKSAGEISDSYGKGKVFSDYSFKEIEEYLPFSIKIKEILKSQIKFGRKLIFMGNSIFSEDFASDFSNIANMDSLHLKSVNEYSFNSGDVIIILSPYDESILSEIAIKAREKKCKTILFSSNELNDEFKDVFDVTILVKSDRNNYIGYIQSFILNNVIDKIICN